VCAGLFSVPVGLGNTYQLQGSPRKERFGRIVHVRLSLGNTCHWHRLPEKINVVSHQGEVVGPLREKVLLHLLAADLNL
jgi:hypothetical protein